MNLCLNMIVKNESARIERCLASVAPYINSWVIIDTGSIDNTKQKIVDFFYERSISGEVRDSPFEDWSQSRNAALTWARDLSFAYEPDYFLLVDADMELVVKDPEAFLGNRDGASYEMYQHAGWVHYTNSRLVKRSETGLYKGGTHEYLDITSAGVIPESVAYFIDHADGANRPEKFKRDIRLLKRDLKKNPGDARAMYYLAQSYRDAGQPTRAITWFRHRVAAGGWDEEVWQAQVGLAHACKDAGHEAEFIRNLHIAYNMRPTRAEPMFDLAHHYREKNMPAPALAAAEAVVHLPRPDDKLFVNDFVYKTGIKEEIGITGYWVPGKKHAGLRATNEVAMQDGPYWQQVNVARQNIYHYLSPLSEFCKSFDWAPLAYTPPNGWAAMNPSICTFHDALHVNVRLVNYRIDEDGRYLIRGLEDGTITGENPIHTRNVVLYLGKDLDPIFASMPWAFECYRDGNMPNEFPLVQGFEDVRLFQSHEHLYASATVRQLQASGVPEQVLTRLEQVKALKPTLQHVEMERMSDPLVCNKNWAPIISEGLGPIRFMSRPGHVVTAHGTVIKHATPIAVDNISGGSQIIRFGKHYWLGLHHIANNIPGSHLRHYYHRFIEYNDDFSVRRVSLPFYLNERGIEFVAGMCSHPLHSLVISYGFKDCEARIATVSAAEVDAFLERS